MRATQDFNYKVALASGLKSLQGGRLRQAEEHFRYLVAKFPGHDGGYRGLARVLIELDDRPAAVAILKDGASALARAGHRDAGIVLLRDALALDPLDHSTHRRLSAALALAGDPEGAVSEVHRYVDGQLVLGNVDRARQEIEYALGRFGAHPRLLDLAQRNAVERSPAPQHDRSNEPLNDGSNDRSNGVGGEDTPAPTELASIEQPAASLDPTTAEARSVELIARRDPRAASVALEAAEWHLLEGRTNAASDLLLQLISSEIAGHDAQLLLVDVVRSAGKRDVAKAKCVLLAQALRLQGNEKLAGEVDRLAEAV